MKLGLGSYAFRWSIGIKDHVPETPMTPLDVLEVARDMDLDVVQYADNMPLHRQDTATLDRLAHMAREAGIALEVGTQSFDADDVRTYLAIARRLDARLLRVALDAADARIPVSRLAADLTPLVAEAAAQGVSIAMENHFNYPSARMVELVETVNSSALGVCLDVANSICAGEWPEDTVRLLAPYAINLHFKDYEIDPDPYGVGFRILGTPLGQGRAPLSWVLDQLPATEPDMSVILEHWLPADDGNRTAAAAQERPWLTDTVTYARHLLSQRGVT